LEHVNAERAYAAGVTTSPRQLPATAYALLGLLSFGRELTGYDLKKWADHSLSMFFWSPAMSQIYAELPRLEHRGYVASSEAPHGDARTKRVYRITPAGLEELQRWLRESPVDVPMLKHPTLLRVWLGHLLDGEQLQRIVTEHLARTEEQLVGVRRDLGAEGSKLGYSMAILRWAERHYENERDNARQLLAELREQSPTATGRGAV
jgi:DNA-binding PadR family transcriptional regulator